MRVLLSVDVVVHRVSVFAEMAFMERRPELGLLCHAALEADGHVSRSIVESALPGIAVPGIRNLLDWCEHLGLVDRDGRLTDVGEQVAGSFDAPVPEQGVYRMWLAEHELIGRRALHIQRLASKSDGRFELIKALPVRPIVAKVFHSVIEPNTRFLVRGFPSNHDEPGCLLDETAKCTLRWTLDFEGGGDEWQLDGNIEVPEEKGNSARRAMLAKPESTGIDLWSLAKQWGQTVLRPHGQWSSSNRRLAVRVADVNESGLQSFEQTLTVSGVAVPGRGTFSTVVFEAVPIGPVHRADAQQWAMARLERQLSSEPAYRSREAVRTLFADLTDETPLQEHQPTLPSHDELVGASRAGPKDLARFWSLAAPVDLAPVQPRADELAAFQIGGPSGAVSGEAGLIRIPHQASWSMGEMVRRLLDGSVPHRLLLCDRYVCGRENLAALQLLVDAVRGHAPAAIIDIWTGEEAVAELAAIKAITGTAPRTYRSVFNSRAPHDRYFLVAPVSGASFGWHMSNSPLHVRSPRPQVVSQTDSPLRWKDFMATQVSAGEFEPAFNEWLGGRR